MVNRGQSKRPAAPRQPEHIRRFAAEFTLEIDAEVGGVAVAAGPHLGSLSADTAEMLGRQLLASIFLVVLLSQWLRSFWLRRALDHAPA